MPSAISISKTFFRKDLVNDKGEIYIQKVMVQRDYLQDGLSNKIEAESTNSKLSQLSIKDPRKYESHHKKVLLHCVNSNKPKDMRFVDFKLPEVEKEEDSVVVSVVPVAQKMKSSYIETPPLAGAHIHDALTANKISLDLSVRKRIAKYQRNPDEDAIEIPLKFVLQPATHERLTRIQIECDSPGWRPIVISEYSPVTVEQVLEAIYSMAHESVGDEELHELTPTELRNVRNAARERNRKVGKGEKWNKETIERVDFLGEKTFFRGLTVVGSGPDILKMLVA